ICKGLSTTRARKKTAINSQFSQLQPFVLCKELHYFRLDGLFFGEVRNTVATLYQFLDLLLNNFLLRLRLSALSNVVLIVHRHDSTSRIVTLRWMVLVLSPSHCPSVPVCPSVPACPSQIIENVPQTSETRDTSFTSSFILHPLSFRGQFRGGSSYVR